MVHKKIMTIIKDKQMAEENFWCEHCGLRFRYKCNKIQHEKKCNKQYSQTGKFKDVTLK